MIESSGETLVANVVHFVRLLRAAGLRVGPGEALDASRAVAAIDVTARAQFHAALHATLVHHEADRPLFDEAFRLFWRDPTVAESAFALLLPHLKLPTTRTLSRRLSEAWRSPDARSVTPARPRVDTFLAYSADEVLRRRDFDEMSADELARARVLVRRLASDLPVIATRRTVAALRGRRIDAARTVREALHTRGELGRLWRRRRRERPLSIVTLLDISGSMGRYSELVLRFLHTLHDARGAGHVFTFATHLTNVTRTLRQRDVDHALAKLGVEVTDWSSGTRLGGCLREFNLRWSRRVLASGAIVLLVSDGLDREDPAVLGAEAARLRRSCRRLVWLNPLLRYPGFEPRAAGVRALLPNVDEHRPVHDLDSLESLARALAGL